MVQDHLTETVLRRLDELALPLSLIELGEFRDHFFQDGWVMFVRDHDTVANVHLIQPRQGIKILRRMPTHAKL